LPRRYINELVKFPHKSTKPRSKFWHDPKFTKLVLTLAFRRTKMATKKLRVLPKL